METFSDGKTSKFLEAISKYAEEQRSKLSLEAERVREAEKVRVEDEILSDAYQLIRKEMAEMRIAISSDRAKKEIESRKKLFDKRKEIVDEVFSAAKDRLYAFVETKEYIKFLENSAKKIASVLDEEDIVIYICDRDKSLLETIKKMFSKDYKIEVSNDIHIGGLKAFSKTRGIIVDESIDEKLCSQYEWFIENSNLRVS